MDQQQAKFEGWAVVEMMGHQREIGYVTTEAYGVAVMFRVDQPEIPAQELVLTRPEWGIDPITKAERLLPVGATVRREGIPAKTRLVAPAALYAINPCTEEAARAAILHNVTRQVICIEFPKSRELPAVVGQQKGGEVPSIGIEPLPGTAGSLFAEGSCQECGARPGQEHAECCEEGYEEAQADDEHH